MVSADVPEIAADVCRLFQHGIRIDRGAADLFGRPGELAGDHLKTASDLEVPLYGIGLLYQQGYFRQVLSPDGWQLEAFPFNDPTSLPVVPLQNHDGGWLRIKLESPGRTLLLRVWQAVIGKVRLYLLDSNDLLNSPWDRAITATLYRGRNAAFCRRSYWESAAGR